MSRQAHRFGTLRNLSDRFGIMIIDCRRIPRFLGEDYDRHGDVITPSRLRQLSGRDRNAQFEYISGKIQEHLSNHQPAISVDTKKKELVGNSQFDIASTCTETGLRVRCELDTRTYPKGLKVVEQRDGSNQDHKT